MNIFYTLETLQNMLKVVIYNYEHYRHLEMYWLANDIIVGYGYNLANNILLHCD